MKTALVVFPDEWLPYCPTILNIVQSLREEGWSVKVIAVDNNRFEGAVLKDVDICYIKINPLLVSVLEKFRVYKFYVFYKFLKMCFCLSSFKKINYDLVFGVDPLGFIAARLFFRKVIYLSLEIRKDLLLTIARFLGINSLIIQTPAREKYLLGDYSYKSKTFYIQNAPILKGDRLIPNRSGYRLIYLGTIIPSHGVEHCIKVLRLLDGNYTLTLKGVIFDKYREFLLDKYQDVFNEGRLFIDNKYVPQDGVVKYLVQYDIGFCFYNFEIIESGDFNYISAPSGKLFNYYAAGVPVIGTSILGLQSVTEFHAGVLLERMESKEILKAIKEIKGSYEMYANNAIKAAQHYDFKKSFDHFLNGTID